MKTIFDKHKWLQIIYGVLILAAGTVLFVLAINDNEAKATWLSVLVAIGLFIFGACAIAAGLFDLGNKYFNSLFVIGALAIAIGVVLCKYQEIIGNVISIFVGVVLLSFGAVELGEAAAMIFFKKNKLFIALFFVLGAILITLGVLSLVFDEVTNKIIYFALGILGILLGAFEIILGVISVVQASKIKQQEKQREEIKENAVVETQDPSQLN